MTSTEDDHGSGGQEAAATEGGRTDDVANVCPRCGEQARGQRFCVGCGLNLEQQQEAPTRAEWEASSRAKQESVVRERGGSKAQPQARASPLRLLVSFLFPSPKKAVLLPKTALCPGCRAVDLGYSECRSCGFPLRENDMESAGTPLPRSAQVSAYRDTATPPPQSGRGVNADSPAAFRTARLVALIAAIASGALTALHWYEASISGTIEGTVSAGESLWSLHPELAALVVAGAVLVAGTSSASLFRVPNDRPNLSPVVLGFSVIGALVMVVASGIGLARPPGSTEIYNVTDTAWGVVALVLAMIAVGGTGVMLRAGRELPTEATAPSAAKPSEATVPESAKPALGANAASPAAPTSPQGTRRDSDGDQVKRCPECAEWVKDAAHVCRYCGFRFAS